MGRRRSAQDAELATLYEAVPDVGCKGLCAAACGPIDMSPREASRLREAGVEIPRYDIEDVLAHARGELPCPALTEQGRCGVYEIRPMVCRLWGAIEALACPHGCRPAGGLLPDVEGQALIAAAARAGGAIADAERAEAVVADARTRPDLQELLTTVLSVGANRDGGPTEQQQQAEQDRKRVRRLLRRVQTGHPEVPPPNVPR